MVGVAVEVVGEAVAEVAAVAVDSITVAALITIGEAVVALIKPVGAVALIRLVGAVVHQNLSARSKRR